MAQAEGRPGIRDKSTYLTLAKPLRYVDAGWVEPSGAVVFFDDFLGDTMAADNWLETEDDNAGTTGTNWAVSTAAGDPSAGHGGWVKAIASADADNASEQLAGQLAWKAERAGSGMLVFESVITIPTAVAVHAINVGLTDDRSTDKLPMEWATTTWTTNASDAAMFVYDDDGTANGFHIQTVDTDVDGTAVLSVISPSDATSMRLRIELDADGQAWFYSRKASAASAYPLTISPEDDFDGFISVGVTPSVLLAPYFGVETRSATATTNGFEVDYCLVACGR